MRTRILALLAVIAAFMAVATPAQAIIDGVPDEGAHPYVGEVVLYVPSEDDPRFDDPGFWSTCTGTLVSPTVVVTAGHCADRKSTRLNSSHANISYAVFCLK